MGVIHDISFGRSLLGERGLKYKKICTYERVMKSLSAWRAWIEIKKGCCTLSFVKSLSAWRAWIEIHNEDAFFFMPSSLSAWRAWIEIQKKSPLKYFIQVALCLESVD